MTHASTWHVTRDMCEQLAEVVSAHSLKLTSSRLGLPAWLSLGELEDIWRTRRTLENLNNSGELGARTMENWNSLWSENVGELYLIPLCNPSSGCTYRHSTWFPNPFESYPFEYNIQDTLKYVICTFVVKLVYFASTCLLSVLFTTGLSPVLFVVYCTCPLFPLY